jgi:hypothetical protein
MATYYVQPSGNNNNSGLNASNAGAWSSVSRAFAGTGYSNIVTGGDTVYVGPGVYREGIGITATYNSTVMIIADPTASLFPSVSPAPVRVTTLASDDLNQSTTIASYAVNTNNKQYVTFKKFWLEGAINAGTGGSIQFQECKITPAWQPTPGEAGNIINLYVGNNINTLFNRCFIKGGVSVLGTCSGASGIRFSNCMFQLSAVSSGAINFFSAGAAAIYWTNCTFFGASTQQVFRCYAGTPTAGSGYIYNCLIIPDYCQPTLGGAIQNFVYENYNAGYITRTGVDAGANTKQLYHRDFYAGPPSVYPVPNAQIFMNPLLSGNLAGAGSSAYTYDVDFMGNTWADPPSIGCMEYKSTNTIGSYLPTDKTFTNLTLAPDSTSQTIYLSVGSTGIGFSASGISCYYTRDGASPVGIGLTAQTATGAWVSGGFAEVDSTNQPGIYRLDVPNAALSSGVNKVLVSFRGAAGVNGAYCNISLNYTRLPDVESRTFVSGNTSTIEYINITQSNSGVPLTGLTYQSSGLTAYYVRPGGTPTSITLNSQTATGAFTSGGFVAVDNTNMPGLYRIDIPNAVFATGVTKATVYLRGAGNMNPIRIEYK